MAASVPPGIIINRANVTSPTPDPDLCNNVAVLPSLVCVESDLGVTKTDGVLQVTAGQINATTGELQVFTYTIVGTNYGPSDARNVIFTDVWPTANPGFHLIGIRGVPGNNCTTTTQGFTCEFPYVAAGASVTFFVDYTVDPCMLACEACNAVSIRSDSPEPATGFHSNVAVDCNQVRTEADLSVCKTDGVTTVTAGLLDVNGNPVVLTYTIEVCNAGPSCAQKVNLIDYFPPQVVRIPGTTIPQVGSCIDVSVPNHPSSFSCDLLTLAPGQCVVVHSSYTVPGNATTCSVVNTAVVSSYVTFDPQLCNNEASDVNALVETANLHITKTSDVTSIRQGDYSNHTFTITVWNSGPSWARDVIVSDLWPAGLVPFPLGITTSQGTIYHQSVGDFTVAVGDIAPGRASAVTITAAWSVMDQMGPGPLTNTASVFSPSDPAGCKTANVTVTVLPLVTKQAAPQPAARKVDAAPTVPAYREVHAAPKTFAPAKKAVIDPRLTPLHADVTVTYDNVTGLFNVAVVNPSKVSGGGGVCAAVCSFTAQQASIRMNQLEVRIIDPTTPTQAPIQAQLDKTSAIVKSTTCDGVLGRKFATNWSVRCTFELNEVPHKPQKVQVNMEGSARVKEGIAIVLGSGAVKF